MVTNRERYHDASPMSREEEVDRAVNDRVARLGQLKNILQQPGSCYVQKIFRITFHKGREMPINHCSPKSPCFLYKYSSA